MIECIERSMWYVLCTQVPEAHEAEVEMRSALEDASNRGKGVRPHLYVALAAAHFKLHHTAHVKVQECSAQTRWVRPYILCRTQLRFTKDERGVCCNHPFSLGSSYKLENVSYSREQD